MTAPIKSVGITYVPMTFDTYEVKVENHNTDSPYAINFSQLLNGRSAVNQAGPNPPRADKWSHLPHGLQQQLNAAYSYYKTRPEQITDPKTRAAINGSKSAEEWVNNLPNGASDAIQVDLKHFFQGSTFLLTWAQSNFETDIERNPVGDFGEKISIRDEVGKEVAALEAVIAAYGGNRNELIRDLGNSGGTWTPETARKLFEAIDQYNWLGLANFAPLPKELQPNKKPEGFKIDQPAKQTPPPNQSELGDEFIPGYTPLNPLENLPTCSYPAVKVEAAVPPTTNSNPSLPHGIASTTQATAVGTLADSAISLGSKFTFVETIQRPSLTFRPAATAANAVGAIGGALSMLSLILNDKENRAATHCMMNPYSLECSFGTQY